ncbi:MAG: hypothetical protein ACJAT7_003528 [Psychromonas sp.]|jgi:hypothetical protein
MTVGILLRHRQGVPLRHRQCVYPSSSRCSTPSSSMCLSVIVKVFHSVIVNVSIRHPQGVPLRHPQGVLLRIACVEELQMCGKTHLNTAVYLQIIACLFFKQLDFHFRIYKVSISKKESLLFTFSIPSFY